MALQPMSATHVVSPTEEFVTGGSMRKTRLLAVASVVAISAAAQAHAAGFYIQEQSVRGTGRAYSGEVADQGVESLWWNPAAIARSGRELYAGASGIFVSGQVSDRGSTLTPPLGTAAPVGGDPRAFKPILPGLVPNFAVATPLGDRFAVGFSLAAPFNFTTQYQPNSWTRYDALTSTLRTVDAQVTGAMRVTDWLDVGASVDTQFTQARLSNAVPNFFGGPDGMQSLRGEGWNVGWSVGAQAHLDKLTLGGSYRSKMNHSLAGKAAFSGLLAPFPASLDATQSAKATFTTPWVATFGGRYALTDRLTLNGQVQRIGWGEFKTINVTTPLGPEIFAQNYHDTTAGGVGLDYAASPRLTLRTGVQYDPTPTPEVGRTARVPDGDRWLFGAGATLNATQNLKLDAAFLYIKFKDSRINATPTFFDGTLAASGSHLLGDVQAAGYVLSLGMRSSF
jgi:long-chain fatty acid transport protein